MFGILVFGDSIAFGRGESPNIGWSGRLKKDFEPKGFHHCLFNLAIPGETSTTLLKRFEKEIKARVNYYYPKDKFIIILAIGINDSRGLGSQNKLETKQDKFKNNIKKLIKIAKKYTKYIIIVGLTQIDESVNPFEGTYFSNKRIQEYNKILKSMKSVKFIDVFKGISEKDLIDGLHPNKKGYEKIYKIIKKKIII